MVLRSIPVLLSKYFHRFSQINSEGKKSFHDSHISALAKIQCLNRQKKMNSDEFKETLWHSLLFIAVFFHLENKVFGFFSFREIFTVHVHARTNFHWLFAWTWIVKKWCCMHHTNSCAEKVFLSQRLIKFNALSWKWLLSIGQCRNWINVKSSISNLSRFLMCVREWFDSYKNKMLQTNL